MSALTALIFLAPFVLMTVLFYVNPALAFKLTGRKRDRPFTVKQLWLVRAYMTLFVTVYSAGFVLFEIW